MPKRSKKEQRLKNNFDRVKRDPTLTGQEKRATRRTLKRHMGKVARKNNNIDLKDI
jgi:hypothetical protein